MSRYRGFGEREVGEAMDARFATDAQFTADPIYTPPPSVTVEQSTGTGFLDTLFGVVDRASASAGKMVDIFGRQVAPPSVQSRKESVPVWVYLAIPVALIGVVALMRRKPSGGLGYRRSRRSRRSRR